MATADELSAEMDVLQAKHLQLSNQIGRLHTARLASGEGSGISLRHLESLRAERRTAGHRISAISAELGALRRGAQAQYGLTLADWFVRVAEKRLSAAEFYALREEAREEMWRGRGTQP
jgi:hypothetical protein